MVVTALLGNTQKLDGGAMFGNAPKAMWQNWAPADELNRIELATRALLARTKSRTILFETGIGAYMEPKYRKRYGVQEEEHALLANLRGEGISEDDITDIILSHMHFDHCGGLLSAYEEGVEPKLLFPNARYYVGEFAWNRATAPHRRDKASFVPALNAQLQESGRLQLVNKNDALKFDELTVQFFVSDGHTPGMLCSDLSWETKRMLFAADLIPGTPWLHLPITMGYDRYPELLIDEKEHLLSYVSEQNAWLFYTHDPHTVASKVQLDEARGRFVVRDPLTDLDKINAERQ